MNAPLVDIGLNLTHDSFDLDRDALLARAEVAGVRHMIVTGSSLATSREAIRLASADRRRFGSTAGVHPHHASEFRAEHRGDLYDLLRHAEVLAVGECGLDFFRNFSPPADQERAFRLQLELAVEVQKPLFLHQRDAHDAFVAILKDYLPRTAGGVAHCFTAGIDEAKCYLDMGLYIGITGWLCDERRGRHLQEVVKTLPLERLLIETDAPYLLPRDLKPKPASRRNEPAYLVHVLQTIAHLRGEEPEAIARATTDNARRLFKWPLL